MKSKTKILKSNYFTSPVVYKKYYGKSEAGGRNREIKSKTLIRKSNYFTRLEFIKKYDGKSEEGEQNREIKFKTKILKSNYPMRPVLYINTKANRRKASKAVS